MKTRPLAAAFALGLIAWSSWLMAADTAHEDALQGEFGSFHLSLANPLFVAPRVLISNAAHFDKGQHPTPWDKSFKDVIDSFDFDKNNSEMLWQHGHPVPAALGHTLRVAKLVNGQVNVSTHKLTPASGSTPSHAIDIRFVGVRPDGSTEAIARPNGKPHVRIVMAKTNALHDPSNCEPRRTPGAGPASRPASRRRPPCLDGHRPGMAHEDLHYSWVIMTAGQVQGDRTWNAADDPNQKQGRRRFRYLPPAGFTDVKAVSLTLANPLQPEGGQVISLADADCAFFQVCANGAASDTDPTRVAKCNDIPVSAKRNGVCTFREIPRSPSGRDAGRRGGLMKKLD